MPEVTVNGVQLAYQRFGEGPTVLLIAGMHLAEAWHTVTVPQLVSAGYTVVSSDHRGLPPSEVPGGPYSIERLTEDAIVLTETLGLAPVHLVGTSLGGLVAQRIAVDRPELVRSVALLAGFGTITPFGIAFFDAFVELFSREPRNLEIERFIALPCHGDASVGARRAHERAGQSTVPELHCRGRGRPAFPA